MKQTVAIILEGAGFRASKGPGDEVRDAMQSISATLNYTHTLL